MKTKAWKTTQFCWKCPPSAWIHQSSLLTKLSKVDSISLREMPWMAWVMKLFICSTVCGFLVKTFIFITRMHTPSLFLIWLFDVARFVNKWAIVSWTKRYDLVDSLHLQSSPPTCWHCKIGYMRLPWWSRMIAQSRWFNGNGDESIQRILLLIRHWGMSLRNSWRLVVSLTFLDRADRQWMKIKLIMLKVFLRTILQAQSGKPREISRYQGRPYEELCVMWSGCELFITPWCSSLCRMTTFTD